MDVAKLKRYLKTVQTDRALKDPTLDGAIWLAANELAHYVDIPSLQGSGTLTIASGTPNYEISDAKKLDRILSAVFVGDTKKTPLEETDMRRYDWLYRGKAVNGTPTEFAYWEKQMWLYRIPDETGTVYYRYQKMLTTIGVIGDNLIHLMYQLSKRNIFDDDPNEWIRHDRLVQRAMRTFKGRVRPYKNQMEIGAYRRQRAKSLTERF